MSFIIIGKPCNNEFKKWSENILKESINDIETKGTTA
jgi:hypothetical protein